MSYKVLQIVNSLGMGGIEAFVANLLSNIDPEQVSFDICTIETKAKERLSDVEARGARVFYYPPFTGRNFFEFFRWWKVFFKEHHDYAVVHGHVYTTASIYLWIAHNAGLKTICHSHGTNILRWDSGKFNRKIRLLFIQPLKSAKWIDLRLACSIEAGKWLYGNLDYRVIKNGIDVTKYRYDQKKRNAVRDSFGLNDSFVVGHVANGNPAKNHMFLMQVFHSIFQKNPSAKLMLIGDLGAIESRIRDFVRDNGLQDAVYLLGTRKDVPDLMMAMDCFVLPSKSEGLPFVLIEAQTSGLPCVASTASSKESDIGAGLMKWISLDVPINEWAETILSTRKVQREDRTGFTIHSGFSIENTAKEMMQIYHGYASKQNSG